MERESSRERSRAKRTEIESNILMKIHKYENATNPNDVFPYQYQFDYSKWLELGLKQNYQFNKEVFGSRGNRAIDEKYLHLIREEKSRHENLRFFTVKPFIIRLDQYVTKIKKKIQQDESEQIIKQVVQAVHHVLKDRYVCYNFRAENFVRVAEKKQANCPQKYRWKLQSLPFGYKNSQNSQVDSPFTWKKEFQPPEASQARLTDTQLSESLVWNVGCLWLFILTGNHLLKSKKEINDYLSGKNSNILNDQINLSALGIQKNCLSEQNRQTLMRMLQVNPKHRMKKQELFKHSTFGQNIVDLKIPDNATEYTTEHSGIIVSSIFQNHEQYQTFRNFLENLLRIIKTKEIHILPKQKTAISKINKNIEPQEKPNDLSEFSPTRITKQELLSKISGSNNRDFEEITFEELQKFIFPYKLYYDKIIFLTRCTKRMAKQLAGNIKQNRYQNQMLSENSELIYIFKHAMCFMRLVYLQNLQQNLQLFQNVFNIPHCINNIRNTNFDNTDPKWLIFSCTGMYQALQVFFKQKLSECQAEFISLIQNGIDKISRAGSQKLKQVKDSYKQCSLDSFAPYFYSVIRDVLTKIDSFSSLNEGFKYVLSETEEKEKMESNRYIGILLHIIHLENQRMHNKEAYQKYFPHLKKDGRIQTMHYPKQSNIHQSTLTVNQCENMPCELIPTIDNIFSFQGEEDFLLKTQSKDITEVSKHVKRLLHKFSY